MIRALLLYTSAGGGHRSAANAIAAELQLVPGATVEVRDVLEFAPSWFAYDKAWSLIQRHGTHAWDWFFDTTERGTIDLDAVRLPLNAVVLRALDEYVLATRPTHIVCTHYLPAVAVARVAPRVGARTVVTVTDHLAHRAWLVPGIDAVCVADAAMARAIRGRTTSEVVVTGIPIASRMAVPVRAVASDLKRAKVLVLLSGVPTSDACAAIDGLQAVAQVHDVEVLCGASTEVLAHARRTLPGARVAARTEQMLAALDAADVVVTKAGGLTVSECLARGRALVLPFAAPGQERGNARYAATAGAGVRIELAELGVVLEELIATPGALRRMGAHARRASHPDAAQQAARCVLANVMSTEIAHAA